MNCELAVCGGGVDHLDLLLFIPFFHSDSVGFLNSEKIGIGS